MKTFHIKVQETLSKVVAVKAESLEDALIQIENEYRNEDITLEYSDFDGVEISEA